MRFHREPVLDRDEVLSSCSSVLETEMKTKARHWFCLIALIAACAASSNSIAADVVAPYPEPDTQLGERLYPNEPALAQRLASVIEGTIRKQYKAGAARRDAHPKGHGCVKAELHVD